MQGQLNSSLACLLGPSTDVSVIRCRSLHVPTDACPPAGCEGVAAINTIQSVMGVNLDTLRPEPSVEGYSTPGGYSGKAVKPIALARVRRPRIRLACRRQVSV